MSRRSSKEIDGVAVIRPQSQRQVWYSQMNSPARSTAQARGSAAMVVLHGCRADASMDFPATPFYRKPIDVTLSSTDPAEMMRFPTMPRKCCLGNGKTSFEAQYRKPLGGVFRVGGSLGEISEYSFQRRTARSPEKFMLGKTLVQTTTDSIASTSSGATIKKKFRRHHAAHKALEEVNSFDPGSIYTPAAVAADSLRQGGHRVICCLRVCFSLPGVWFQISLDFRISTAVQSSI